MNRFLLKPCLFPRNIFLHGYLNDCFLIPAALPPLLLVYRKSGLREGDGVPTLTEVGCHFIFWAVFFEWVGPHLFHRGTSDVLDTVVYLIGGGVSWFFWNWRRPRS